MTSNTTALLDNLATLRATRDAIMAEIDAIQSAPAEVEPCDTCGNDFADYNCSCELPEAAAYDW